MRVNRIKSLTLPAIKYSPIFIWFLLLYPGRLGFDGSELIRIIQNKKSTDWWSSNYYWFIKIVTLNGKSIAFASFLGLLILFYAINQFIDSFPISDNKIGRIIKITIFASPFYGFVGATVSHDVTLISGVLLILTFEYRRFRDKNFYFSSAINVLVIFLLLTNTLGFPILIFYLFTLRKVRNFNFLCSIILAILITSFAWIHTTHESKIQKFIPLLVDMKCAVQNEKSELSLKTLNFMNSLAPLQEWKIPSSCGSAQLSLYPLKDLPKEPKIKLSDLISSYIDLLQKHPYLVIASHIQRSAVSIPPPISNIGVLNLVNYNDPDGLGSKSNMFMQDGAELFHPSIDEQSVKVENKFFLILNGFAYISAFLFNQNSSFWGWGGLWLWPIFLVSRRYFQFSLISTLKMHYPIMLIHVSLLCFAPESLPRYTLSTIIVGVSYTILMISSFIKKEKNAS